MQIKELKASDKPDLVEGEVISVKDIESINIRGQDKRVRNGRMKDESGEIDFKIWEGIAEQIKVGDILVIEKGFVKEWDNQIHITKGKYGVARIKDE